MNNFVGRLRPNVLLICVLLTAVCVSDILAPGSADVGLAAVGGLVALGRDILERD